MSKKVKVEYTNLYCLNCGKPTPIPRKIGHRYPAGHRKVLYCPFCKETVNHIGCRTYAEIVDFQERFNKGEFVNESQESIDYVRANGCRQNLLWKTLY